jgi:dienelactone hydrolase
MRTRHLTNTALMTALLSCFAVTSAQDAPPPLQIERVPLINIQISTPSTNAPKASADKDKSTTKSTTGKTSKPATKPATKQAAKAAEKTDKTDKTPEKPAEKNARASTSVISVPSDNTTTTSTTSESNGNITNITTHNNSVTYNITNHVSTSNSSNTSQESKHVPAIMLNVNPDTPPEVKPLQTPATIITPPPAPIPPTPPAPPLDPVLPEDDVDMTNEAIDNAGDAPSIDDITPGEVSPDDDGLLMPEADPDMGISPDEEIIAPEELIVPEPESTPPAAPAPQAAPTPAPAAPSTAPAATPPSLPINNTNPASAPVTQAPKPVTSQVNNKSSKPATPKKKRGITIEKGAGNPSPIIRTINNGKKKHITRIRSGLLLVQNKPAPKPTPQKNPVIQKPAPYGLWIKTTKGSGKKPTIIAMHGCGGLYSTIAGEKSQLTPRHETMVRVFTSAGYNVFLPDSFTPRGKHGNCTENVSEWAKTSQTDRVDIAAALAWLSKRNDVDMRRIALFGWSYGATTVFAALNLAYTDVAIRDFQPRAAITFYPSCSAYLDANMPFKLAAPALILVGENDTLTPAKPCERFEKRVANSENTITLRTYPDTYHDFDAPGTPIYVRLDITPADGKPGGITAGGNPISRAAAYKEILMFLEEHM